MTAIPYIFENALSVACAVPYAVVCLLLEFSRVQNHMMFTEPRT